MGNANIDEELKKDIEELLKDIQYRAKYQNLKGFIDNVCLELLDDIIKKKEINFSYISFHNLFGSD